MGTLETLGIGESPFGNEELAFGGQKSLRSTRFYVVPNLESFSLSEHPKIEIGC